MSIEKETVNIHGKDYETVASRIKRYRNDFPPPKDAYCIYTEILEINADRVVIQAKITTPDGVIVGSGIAEEVREATQINKTSAVENCETSAIGRALASIGYLSGSYASADEVERALKTSKSSKLSKSKSDTSKTYTKAQFGMIAGLLTDIIPPLLDIEVLESHDTTKLASKLLKGADKNRASEIIDNLKQIQDNINDMDNADIEIQQEMVKLTDWAKKVLSE